MESRSPLAAKRLRSYLRVAFFMLRKGLISKRKLVMDINLMMKRGKLIRKGLGDLVFHHHHRRPRSRDYGLQEYELSCSTSPNPVFFHAKRATRRNYFPCIGSVAEDDDPPPSPAIVASFPKICYSVQGDLVAYSSSHSSFNGSEGDEEVVGRTASPENDEVDNAAELFIGRFYEQLRKQSHVARLQYELDYQDMLTRGH